MMSDALELGAGEAEGVEPGPAGATPAPERESAEAADAPAAHDGAAAPSGAPTADGEPSVPPSCALASAEERLASLSEGLARVEDAVRTRMAEADQTGRLVDRLEAEVRRLRQREDERRLEPAVKGVIGLFDQVARVASDVRGRQPELSGPEREMARTLAALEQQFLELLGRLGATALVPEPATRFDGQRQEVIDTLDTPEQEKHLTVASVRRPGFEFAGRVCRPAAVQVFRYVADVEPQEKEIVP